MKKRLEEEALTDAETAQQLEVVLGPNTRIAATGVFGTTAAILIVVALLWFAVGQPSLM
jgi:hypothetical protein